MRWVLAVLLVAGCATSDDAEVAIPEAAKVSTVTPLLSDSFNGPDRLITNEYAYWNPTHPDAVISPLYEMTSGSLFNKSGTGWTGVPDDNPPDALSLTGNDSAVFRLTTHRADFGDVAVSFTLKNNGMTSTARTPEQTYDGVHVALRHASQYQTYYLSINRRDDRIVIKKKVAGGTTNGGTYYELTPEVARPFSYGTWQSWRATVRTVNGVVKLELWAEGTRVLAATDDGSLGGPPLTAPGQVGIRGDNCDFQIDAFTVTSL
jgi:hypothetical protein